MKTVVERGIFELAPLTVQDIAIENVLKSSLGTS